MKVIKLLVLVASLGGLGYVLFQQGYLSGVLDVLSTEKYTIVSVDPTIDPAAQKVTYPQLTSVDASREFAAEVDPNYKKPEIRVYRSNWQETRKSLYKDKLVASRPEILVLPFEVQSRPVDKIGRSLMTRSLAARLESSISASVSDVDLVDRALGYNRLRFLDEDVQTLVREVKPSIYVRTYLGHFRNKMAVTSVVYTREFLGSNTYRKRETKTWIGLPFDDVHLPHNSFESIVDEVAELIAPPEKTEVAAARDATPGSESLTLPPSPVDLIGLDESDPVRMAYALQTLGMLSPDSAARERQRLFEKSMMVLNRIPESHPEFQILKARGLFYLKRRPAAVAALEGNPSAEGQALRYYLDANLVGLSQSIEAIASPWKKFLARLELQHLAVFFHYQKEIPPIWAEDFLKERPKWDLLVRAKLEEYKGRRGSRRLAVKLQLDDFYSTTELSAAKLIHGFTGQTEVIDIPVIVSDSVVKHVDDAIEHTEVGRMAGVTAFDYLHLLDGIATYDAIIEVRRLADVYSRPAKAIERAKRYLSVYDGHPDLLIHIALAKFAVQEEQHGGGRNAAYAKIPDLLYQAADLTVDHAIEFSFYQQDLWDLVNKLSAAGVAKRDEIVALADRWSIDQSMFPPVFAGRAGLSMVARHVAYAHHEIYIWEYGVFRLRKNKAEAMALMAENSHRFIGSRERRDVEAWFRTISGGKETLDSYYASAVNAGSHEWKPYWEVANRHVVEGDYNRALEVIGQYPGFLPGSNESRITLSNRAYKAGSLLFDRGAFDHALPLLELSAGYGTGSGGEMGSLARHATIQGKYVDALVHHFRRGKRYNSPQAYRDAISLLHVVGENETAWELFDSMLGVYGQPHIWMSALVGHRVEGSSAVGIERWVSEDHRMVSVSKRYSFPARFALMALTMDRAPDDEVPAIVERLGRGYETRVVEVRPPNPKVTLTLNGKWGVPYKAYPSGEFGRTIYETDEAIESKYSLFARGYNALKREEWEEAYRVFMRLHELYSAFVQVPGSYTFPYLARAATKSGNLDVLEAAIKTGKERSLERSMWESAFALHLGKAFYSAGKGDHDAALDDLEWAFGVRPSTGSRPIMTGYQIVEACLWLYEDSNDPRYLSLALEWSKRYQVVSPMYAWPFAVEAKYSKDPEAKKRALGIALYLDRDSWLLSDISVAEKLQAQEWFESSKPFRQQQPKLDELEAVSF